MMMMMMQQMQQSTQQAAQLAQAAAAPAAAAPAAAASKDPNHVEPWLQDYVNEVKKAEEMEKMVSTEEKQENEKEKMLTTRHVARLKSFSMDKGYGFFASDCARRVRLG
jgi:hypothetical protein